MNIGEKWKRLARELFSFYSSEMKAHGFPVSEILTPWYAHMIQELYKCDVKEGEIREVISFAMKHWEQLRDLDSDGKRLSQNPSFYEMFAPWRFPKWIKLSREGFPTTTRADNNNEVFQKWLSKEKEN